MMVNMLDKIYLYNFPCGEKKSPLLKSSSDGFYLSTCQRTLLIESRLQSFPQDFSFEFFQGDQAYAYLLETICGLKSKLIGENEIVSQFKLAYKDYMEKPHRNSSIMRVLEKLFQDSKDIRTRYLIGLSQKTYSSLARRIILSKHKAPHVLILGSGQLAEDMINQLKKKVPVTIVARNEDRISSLTDKHGVESYDWKDILNKNYQCAKDFSHVINTIGTDKEVLTSRFFSQWKEHRKRCFVDLASPSPYRFCAEREESFYQLDDIFELGAIHEQDKQEKVDQARVYLDEVVEKRASLLKRRKRKPAQYLRKKYESSAISQRI